MNIKEYIESGILESYITGSATEAETRELLYYKQHYPQVEKALESLETDMERIAGYMAVTPPPGLWEKIEANIDELILSPEIELPQTLGRHENGDHDFKKASEQQFIEVESESRHMRVHKNWKWVFVAVFILSKIFLICAIYYYLENRQAQEQILELKTELKQHPVR